MSGETVFAITHKIKDAQGRLAGVLGIDVTLKLLADKFAELSKGNNGYFVLIENTGKILCEPAHPALVGKVLGKDVNDAGMLRVFGTDKGVVRLTGGRRGHPSQRHHQLFRLEAGFRAERCGHLRPQQRHCAGCGPDYPDPGPAGPGRGGLGRPFGQQAPGAHRRDLQGDFGWQSGRTA